jgi:hypothetical protein
MKIGGGHWHPDQHGFISRIMTNPLDKNRRRGGAVLVIVLVVVALLALAAYTFADLMVTHQNAAQLHGRQLQARALAESGSDAVRLYLMQDAATREEAGGHYNNPAFFQAVPVLMDADARLRSNFTVLVPLIDDEGALGGVRYGLEDESTRLNVNALLMIDQVSENAGRNLLMGLPGMTEDIADAILDWIDEDDESREYGAESDYYLGLDPPYSAKNAPLDTVEELLLVRGISPQLLFGVDTNRNGIVDPHEMNAAGMLGTQSGMTSPGFSGTATSNTTTSSGSSTATDSLLSEGSMDRGWVGYLTLYSMESNRNSEGLPRIYLNMEDLESLYDQLAERMNEEWARFIVAYRQSGPSEGSEDGEPASALPDPDFSKESKTNLTQVLDLVGAKIQVQIEGEEKPLVVSSPFSDSVLEMGVYMSLLMDNCTINASTTIPGRININQAPRTLLMGIPGIEEDVVDEIISQRYQETTDEDQVDTHKHETWLMTEGIVTLDEMKTLSPFVTARGDVFRAQIVGYFEDGGAASRVEAVFDATSPRPRILSWKDISHLGRGYPLELLGVQLISNY